MVASVLSAAVIGLSAISVRVEVDIATQGLPAFSIVGLPDKAVEESKERVRSAIKNSGADFPSHRITVNLAPADIQKIGPFYDLPIAVGILVASGQLPSFDAHAVYIGELSLDGVVRHTNGVLPIALFARSQQSKKLFVSSEDAGEACVLQGLTVYPIISLTQLIKMHIGTGVVQPVQYTPFSDIKPDHSSEFDFADIVGQEQGKRALEIAAAGGHNVIFTGPPGAGKTMLARALPSILPSLTEEEALEVTKIYSITGNLPVNTSLMKTRPFRCPHHTTSRTGLIGGGTHPIPGEISLAHRGVLFLDEFPEFERHSIESLRQPVEDGYVTISRASGTVRYPAKFMLIAAANPCPCGNFGSDTKQCTCSMQNIQKYQRKISGPILDRIDLHVYVRAVKTDELVSKKDTIEPSSRIKIRVQQARDMQQERFRGSTCVNNAEMSPKLVARAVSLEKNAESFLAAAVSKFGLSARGYFRIIKVARTIADLEGKSEVSIAHLAEALQYRSSAS